MNVVAVGGGHGLAVTLRACRSFARSLTAVVSVADDGGSTGRLRATMPALPAPGDLRRCLTTMAGADRSLLAAALEHRFRGGDLDGHAAGNVLLAALAAESGDLGLAVDELARVLGVTARVVPATCAPVTLIGAGAGGRLEGQVTVQEADGVRSVALEPSDPRAAPAALAALAAADLVVLGPGSLYTSVLAALAVPALCRAVQAGPGRTVFVANLRSPEPETAGYDVDAQLAALARHGVRPHVALVDDSAIVRGDDPHVVVVRAPLAATGGAAHDPVALGSALAALR